MLLSYEIRSDTHVVNGESALKRNFDVDRDINQVVRMADRGQRTGITINMINNGRPRGAWVLWEILGL